MWWYLAAVLGVVAVVVGGGVVLGLATMRYDPTDTDDSHEEDAW
jgi:hypothetical protein